jgi:membrane associated rhomboid family serine protease
MFLPIGDEPNPHHLPVTTVALIAVNVAVYLLIALPLGARPPDPADPALAEYLRAILPLLPPGTSPEQVLREISAYDLVVYKWGFRPDAASIVTLFTSMFLHGGFMHLFGNMLFLWIYGDNVEHRLGPVKYLFWYLMTGVAATLFFAVLAPGSLVPMVGASGAISGVLGFYFWWFPRNVVRVLVLLFPILVRVIEIPARIVLGIYLFIDNVLPMLVAGSGGGGGVAHGAHIGGFVAGLAAAWVLSWREVDGTPREYRAEAREVSGPDSLIARALQAGDMATAARAYFAMPSHQAQGALTPEQSLALGAWLAENGHAQAAVTVYQRHVRQHPHGPGAAEAHVAAGAALLGHLNQPALAYQHFADALQERPAPQVAAAARAGMAAIASMQKFPARRFSQ